ncbi:ferritin-like domain-containing protein [Lichenihabitans psoromatis]|uniref:YciE/YciF ferroxidase family protein n=1 Tax=Lichenihabitans psoromatis TaxID=2528642 RepID=UPI00103841B1|nr:ferritin-like domain-containing protein [Lichenihabitans psoromatis]
MGSKTRTLSDLFMHTLKDVYYAERHIGKTLPKLAKAADSDELKQAFEQHRDETHAQIERLEQVFELLGKKVQSVPCEAIQGIIEEAKDVMDEFEGSPALDAGLIAAAQAIEHYEIARYGALRSWASQLGLNQVATLLEETLAEEKHADARLSELGERLNAAQGGHDATSDALSESHTDTKTTEH